VARGKKKDGNGKNRKQSSIKKRTASQEPNRDEKILRGTRGVVKAPNYAPRAMVRGMAYVRCASINEGSLEAWIKGTKQRSATREKLIIRPAGVKREKKDPP